MSAITFLALTLLVISAAAWLVLRRRRSDASLPRLRGADLNRVGYDLYGVRRRWWEGDERYRARVMAVHAKIFETCEAEIKR